MVPGDEHPTGVTFASAFEQSMRAALEFKGGPYAASLARLLADLVEGQLSVERFREQVLTDPHLAALLKALVGQQAQAATTTVAFGQGSQVGDVTIRDVIGGHLFQLNIYHDAPISSPPPSPATTRPRRRKSPQVGTRISARSRLTRGSTALPLPHTRRLRVFLCHAAVDKAVVRALYQRLRAAQIDPWLDEEDLLPGQDWRREIPRAVEAADVVLICLSHASQAGTGYLQHEITFALDVAERQPPDSIFLIPLRLVDCPVPERLARWQWVSLYEPDGFRRLLRALRVRAAELELYPPADLLPTGQPPPSAPSTPQPEDLRLTDQPPPPAPPISEHAPDATELRRARELVAREQWRQAVTLYERLLGHGPLPRPDAAELERARRELQRQGAERASKTLTRPPSRSGKATAPAIDVDQTLADLALLLDQYTGVASVATLAARLAENAAVRPATRRRAGALAGRLGDPRYPRHPDEWRRELARRPLGSGARPWNAYQAPPYWCYLPSGSYIVGGWEPEQATSQIELAPFWVARFAITVAQYEPFVAVGYSADAQRWWEPASWRWKRSGAGVGQPRWWDEAPYRGASQPVIGVSWHEATAFCTWLSQQFADGLPEGYQLRLPTEAEWEVAAAWNGLADRRRYPWGDDRPTPALAIFSESGPGRPAPVGCCPTGTTACGALDLAGNVWELTTSGYEGYPAQSHEVITTLRGKPVPWRGGSWQADAGQLACGQRFAARPDRGFDTGGFRIVLAPAIRLPDVSPPNDRTLNRS
ncbi:MAG: SUMF1/EgtB/PvdO family nonheme iron enzyme [Chloroflexales bacterium]|nr:SUMF1/EgtB/PvdO family nonheme iron enzyme [Chloroflexales bacterium]